MPRTLSLIRSAFLAAGVLAGALAPGGRAARAEAVTEPGMKGYGIRAVEGDTLPEMLDRCAAAGRGAALLGPDETQDLLKARCDQLRRSLRNQPGNAARQR